MKKLKNSFFAQVCLSVSRIFSNKSTHIFLFYLVTFFLFFDIDYILSNFYIAGLPINYLTYRLQFRSLLSFVIVFLFIVRFFCKNKVVFNAQSSVSWEFVLGLIVVIWTLWHLYLSPIGLGWAVLKMLSNMYFLLATLYFAWFFINIKLNSNNIYKFLVFILLLGALELGISVMQLYFYNEYSSCLLHVFFVKLGEPTKLVSRAIFNGTYINRTYGTFAHPNIFAFVANLMLLVALSLKKEYKKLGESGNPHTNIYVLEGLRHLFVNITGKQRTRHVYRIKFHVVFALNIFVYMLLILFSVSKSGILASLLILCIYMCPMLFKFIKKHFLGYVIGALALVAITPIAMLSIPTRVYFVYMRNIIFKKALVLNSVVQWLFGVGYYQFLYKLITGFKNSPLIFNGILFVEPIHNIVWLIAFEFGWIFVIFLFFYIIAIIKKLKKDSEKSIGFYIVGLVVLITVFGSFDHFLYY